MTWSNVWQKNLQRLLDNRWKASILAAQSTTLMGVYIYSLRSPKLTANVKLDTGEIVSVGRYAYEYKPISYFFSSEPRWQVLAKARITRMGKIWNYFIENGGKYPQAAVIVGDKKDNYKINIGCNVYTWDKPFLPIAVDDFSFDNAKSIGKVVEILS